MVSTRVEDFRFPPVTGPVPRNLYFCLHLPPFLSFVFAEVGRVRQSLKTTLSTVSVWTLLTHTGTSDHLSPPGVYLFPGHDERDPTQSTGPFVFPSTEEEI